MNEFDIGRAETGQGSCERANGESLQENAAVRDYRLDGPENARARARGLVGAQWYRCPLSRQRLRELSVRRNGPALRDTLIAVLLLAGTGWLAWRLWGTWWALPAFLLYGTLYASLGDSRWHESLHGTAFRTRWMNRVLYHIASVMILRQATPWRYSHLRHHREALIVGRDPEIPLRPQRKPSPLWLDVLKLYTSSRELGRLARHALGRIGGEERDYIPASRHRQVVLEARLYWLVFLLILVACVYAGSILPALFVGLPSMYGLSLVLLTGMLQHVGLPEDVLDLRLNSRTVYMNPAIRFLYWNLNYHLDHHMFPTVPYHALPALHEAIRHDCPYANPGILSGIREIQYIMERKQREPAYVHERPLPETARPYHYGPCPEETKAL